jgi:hypothetical protein
LTVFLRAGAGGFQLLLQLASLFGQILLLGRNLLLTLRRVGAVGIFAQLLRLIGHLILFLAEATSFIAGLRQFFLRISTLRILQHLAGAVQLFERLLRGLLLRLGVAALGLPLHVLSGLLHLTGNVGHLSVVAVA